MKISIVMATYNGAKFISAQLESFLSQTRLPDELIITDDCSTDETEVLVKAFIEKAPFEVIFSRNEDNLGYCGNFNAALMKTTGDLVFLSDQDDVWFPGKISYMSELAEQNPSSLVVMNDAALTDAELNEVGLTKIGQIKSSGLTLDSFVMGCCCAIKRELLELCLPIPDGYASHDGWIVNFADGLKAKRVDGRVLQYYRRHGSNESNFIVNRTTKLTKLHYNFHLFRNVLNKPNTQDLEQHLVQQRLFLDGIDAAKERAGQERQSLLDALTDNVRASIEVSSFRIQIRQRPLVTRIPIAFMFWLQCGYSANSGFRSFIRDCFG